LRYLTVLRKKINHISYLVPFLSLILTVSAAEAGSVRVLIAPFKIHAAEDMTYLREGITEMLTSRLARAQEIEVVGRDELSKGMAGRGDLSGEAEARDLARSLNADYIVLGSLTVLGNSVSVDARLVDLAAAKPELRLANQGSAIGDVVSIISGFAGDIHAGILGVPAPVAGPFPRPSVPAADADIGGRAHPDRLAEQIASGELRMPEGGDFISHETRRELRLLWRSRELDESITGIALGDVTGDGSTETVVISEGALHLYRADAKGFHKLNKLAELRRESMVSVDIADINGNGYAEIFVSVYNGTRDGAVSFVLEYNGSTFERIVDKSPWFFRVIKKSGEKGRLYGQKQSGGPFNSDIFELHWQSPANYIAADRILKSGTTNIIGLDAADFPEAPFSFVAFSPSDHLQVMDQGGKIRWRSTDPSGGNLQYHLMPVKSEGDIENRRYLPMRLCASALSDKMGDEIIVAKNNEATGRRLTQLRSYTRANIESFVWDGAGLSPIWRTRDIQGRISDIAVGDFFNDGRRILLAAVVSREGLIIGTRPRSRLLSFELIAKTEN